MRGWEPLRWTEVWREWPTKTTGLYVRVPGSYGDGVGALLSEGRPEERQMRLKDNSDGARREEGT